MERRILRGKIVRVDAKRDLVDSEDEIRSWLWDHDDATSVDFMPTPDDSLPGW